MYKSINNNNSNNNDDDDDRYDIIDIDSIDENNDPSIFGMNIWYIIINVL